VIPADLPRDEWVKVGMAYQAAGGDFDTFDSWSSAASNYCLKDARAVWRSLDTNGGISAGTLFHYAKQYGYKATSQSAFNPADIQARIIQRQQQQQREQEAKQRGYEVAQQQAETMLDNYSLATDKHSYLINKRIKPRLMPWVDEQGWLVIPLTDLEGNLHSLQRISPTGEKRFLKGGAKKSHFYQLWTGSESIVICEGYATGVTLYSHYTPSSSVFVAFDAGNLLPVATVLRATYPDTEIIIAGDNDKSGTGQIKAKEAALAIGGSFTLPLFQDGEVGSDFNDRWCLDNVEVAA
jgi:putative DNA primase/helicase